MPCSMTGAVRRAARSHRGWNWACRDRVNAHAMCACMCMHVHTLYNMCVHMYMCVHTCACITFVHVHTCVYTCTCVCTHVHALHSCMGQHAHAEIKRRAAEKTFLTSTFSPWVLNVGYRCVNQRDYAGGDSKGKAKKKTPRPRTIFLHSRAPREARRALTCRHGHLPCHAA